MNGGVDEVDVPLQIGRDAVLVAGNMRLTCCLVLPDVVFSIEQALGLVNAGIKVEPIETL